MSSATNFAWCFNSFTATGNNKKLIIMSRFIWIYAVWHSVFQLYFPNDSLLKNKQINVGNLAPEELRV